jgi:PAS domain S-box-containing protein
MKSYLTTCLVLMGMTLLMSGLYFIRKIMRELPATDDRWQIMSILILFFSMGYLLFGITTFGEPFSFVTFVVGLLFFFGGGFTATLAFFCARTIADIKQLAPLGPENNRVRTAQHRMETILSHSSEGIVFFDQHGKIENLSKAAENIFGYAAAEVIGHHINLLIPPPESRGWLQGHANGFVGGDIHSLVDQEDETIGRRKDGTRVFLALRISEVFLDDAPVYTMLAAEISAQSGKLNPIRISA